MKNPEILAKSQFFLFQPVAGEDLSINARHYGFLQPVSKIMRLRSLIQDVQRANRRIG